MFPPVMSRRAGRLGDLEVLAKRVAARGLRWLTWAQTEHDHSVKHALAEARSALAEQRAELEALRKQLAELQAQKKRDS
jgi:hypothetical protein